MSKLSDIRTVNLLTKILDLVNSKDGLYIKHIGVIEGILLANKYLQYGEPIKYATIKYEEPKYKFFGPTVIKKRRESYDEYIIRKCKQYIYSLDV